MAGYQPASPLYARTLEKQGQLFRRRIPNCIAEQREAQELGLNYAVFQEPSHRLADRLHRAIARSVVDQTLRLSNAAIRGSCDMVPSDGCFLFGNGFPPLIPR